MFVDYVFFYYEQFAATSAIPGDPGDLDVRQRPIPRGILLLAGSVHRRAVPARILPGAYFHGLQRAYAARDEEKNVS